MRLAPVLAAAALVAAAVPGAAWGHGERDPAIRTQVDRITPQVPGVTVRVAPGVAQRLELRNAGRVPVEVLAKSGEPFLRVGPGGVEANVASPTWFASGNPDGIYRPGKGIDAKAPPRWRRVTEGGAWAWFAHELHPQATGAAPAEIVAAGRRARLNEWRIGLRAGGEAGAIAGHLEYRPVRGAFSARLVSPPEVAPGVTAAALDARSPGVFLSNRGRRTVEVAGADGRPFALVSAKGTSVNVASPTYREQPGAPAGPAAPPGTAGPRWRTLPTAGTLSWIEPRARYGADEPSARVLARSEPSVVREWTVPLRVGEQAAALRGETRWVPLPRTAAAGPAGDGGGGAAGTLGFVAVALAAGAGGLWWLRRRARRAAV